MLLLQGPLPVMQTNFAALVDSFSSNSILLKILKALFFSAIGFQFYTIFWLLLEESTLVSLVLKF